MKKKTLIKIGSLALSALSLFLVAGCNTSGGEIKVDIPEYAAGGKVDFTAYGSPTNPNWDGGSGNADGLTYEVYKDMADAGFTQVQPIFDGYLAGNATIEQRSAKATKDALKALALCEQLGMKYYVRDWTCYGLVNNVADEDQLSVVENMFGEKNEYIDHPNYLGNFLHDEPTVQQMNRMLPAIEKYQELVPNGRIFVNLLPIYATTVQLDDTGNSDYYDYVDHYCKTIGTKVGYISYDYYPLFKSQYGSSVKNSYLLNYEIVAKAAKQYGLNKKVYIQLCKLYDVGNSRDIIGVQDLRFQIYSGMAFGYTDFIYFGYATTGNYDKLIDINCKPTYRYYAAKTVNNEVHAWENVYTSFEWEGIMAFNGDDLAPSEAFEMLETPLDSHPRIQSVKTTEDTLVGTFKDGEKRDGFMFVNYSDPYLDKTAETTVTFNDAKALLMYRYGQKVIVPLNKGAYTFKLEPGEGRFVIPLK